VSNINVRRKRITQFGGKIGQVMEKNINLTESLGVIKNIADNPSWFGEYAHRWLPEALALGYAMACIEIVAKNSKRAGDIYRKIEDAWGKPGIKTSYNEIISLFPDSEKEDLKRKMMSPESLFQGNINMASRGVFTAAVTIRHVVTCPL